MNFRMSNGPHMAFMNDYLCKYLKGYHNVGAGGASINGNIDYELMSMKRFDQKCKRGFRLFKV